MARIIPLLFLFLLLGCGPGPEPVEVALYFADFMAQFTVPEDRLIEPGNRTLALAVTEELAAGPRSPGLHPPLAAGTRVLGVSVSDGVARVDFSCEFVTNHPGGTAGEVMTIRSLIFTLTDLPEVDAITILVEGEPLTVFGHGELDPVLSRHGIIAWPVDIDRDRAAWLQEQADRGEQLWRLDPVAVARRDGRMAGFRLTDDFTLRSQSGPAAEVATVHQGRTYIIELQQPVRQDETGVWLITAIRNGG